MVPGNTQFTLIPISPTSAAILSVSRTTALFETLYADMLAPPTSPARAATFTIFPPPAAIIIGMTILLLEKTDRALRSSMKCQVSSLVS